MSEPGVRSTIADRHAALALPCLLLVFAAHFHVARPTNFAGYDEWLILSLASRGIFSFPYANRPLNLVWNAPAALLAPHSLTAQFALHAAYLALAGALVYLLCRRLAPGHPGFAFLAAALALVWAPMDPRRLQNLQMTPYSGVTFGTLLAVWLYLESWIRDRAWLLLAAVAIGFASARSFELALPVLAVAPLAASAFVRPRPCRWAAWVGAWAAMAALAAALFALPWVFSRGQVYYQEQSLGLDLTPAAFAGRLAAQYGYHLAPLFRPDPAELLVAAVPIAAGTFAVLCFAMLARRTEAPPSGRYCGALALAGITWAGLAYSAFCLSAALRNANRTQFLAAPGIALALAAAVTWLASRVRHPRLRAALAALLGAWVVAVGTARTAAMQRDWDRESAWPAQSGTLRQLASLAPGLAAPTLVVLLDPGRAWPQAFSFHHAARHLYAGHAAGAVWKAHDFLYEFSYTARGIACEPWPVVQEPWHEPPTTYGYDEVVVVRRGRDGLLSLLDAWPGELPPLPEGASYAPRERIVPGGAGHRVLRSATAAAE
jgi:hypothetical protein